MPRNRPRGATHSYSTVFGVSMIGQPRRLEEGSVFRRVVPTIGLPAALVVAMFPALARAQVNIDQGKSPAEIYSSDCATCHKTPRGLAVGKNSLMLSVFLREHYTASRDQATALAAYVLGAGGAERVPKPKPDVERARAEEPKAGEPKTATHPLRTSARPEEEKRPKQEEVKHQERPGPESPASGEKHEAVPETASRAGQQQPEEAAPSTAAPATNEPPRVAEPPNRAASPEARPTTSAALPAKEQPEAGATVPRDNIPD